MSPDSPVLEMGLTVLIQSSNPEPTGCPEQLEVLEWGREQANSSRGDTNTQVQKHITWKMAVRPVRSRRGRGPEGAGSRSLRRAPRRTFGLSQQFSTIMLCSNYIWPVPDKGCFCTWGCFQCLGLGTHLRGDWQPQRE